MTQPKYNLEALQTFAVRRQIQYPNVWEYLTCTSSWKRDSAMARAFHKLEHARQQADEWGAMVAHYKGSDVFVTVAK